MDIDPSALPATTSVKDSIIVDPRDLSVTNAKALLNEALQSADVARVAAGIAGGALKRRCVATARAHERNALALADALYGAPDPATLAMTDDELIAALSA